MDFTRGSGASPNVLFHRPMEQPAKSAVYAGGGPGTSLFLERTVAGGAVASGHAPLAPAAGTHYYTNCGVLVVNEARHQGHLAHLPPPVAPTSAAALVLA